MSFLKRNKKWILIFAVFILVRIIVFSTFWAASADKGGWANFYAWSQPAQAALMQKFHEPCDWRPPLYYTFASTALFLFKTQWSIYALQLFFTFASLILGYKTIRLFFPEKIAFWATLIWAIEPFWAWQNFQLASENLYMPIFLAAMFCLFSFLKKGASKYIVLASILLGIAAFIRPTALLMPAFISVVLAVLFILRNKIKTYEEFFKKSSKEIVLWLLIFNALFLAVLSPWIIRNKIIYDRFSFANLSYVNVYYYNLPPFIAFQKKISYQEASDLIITKAEKDLGPTANELNCDLYTRQEFNRRLDYFDSESKKYILHNIKDYLPLHLIKMAPFFADSGYFDLYSAYTGEYSKPDITAAFLKGDFKEIKDFLAGLNLKLSIYFFGIILWLALSALAAVAVFYSFFKDKSKFLFFAASMLLAFYTSFLTSPFNFARYRLPLYIFFFTSLVYMIEKLWIVWKNKRK